MSEETYIVQKYSLSIRQYGQYDYITRVLKYRTLNYIYIFLFYLVYIFQ